MKSLITEPLGLYGWRKAEPILLAALLSKLTDGDAPELYGSARLALLNTLPDRARRRLSVAKLTVICKSAWELSMRDESDPLVQLMKIDDPVLRLRKMVAGRLDVPPDRAAVIIGEGVAKTRSACRIRFRPRSCPRRTGSPSVR